MSLNHSVISVYGAATRLSAVVTSAARGSWTRSSSFIAGAAFLIHQFRYLAATGGLDGDDVLQRGNTVFVHSIPIIAGVVIACLTARLMNGCTRKERRIAASARGTVLSYLAAIVAVVSTQQFVEGALLAGHIGGLAAIFAAGGWAALPLAALFGLIAALVHRGIEAAQSFAFALFATPTRDSTAPIDPVAPPSTGRAWVPLTSGFARRPPPALA